MDFFLFHGKIWRGKGQFCDAMIVRKGRIAALGRQQELYPLAGGCSFIDCGGRTMLPGFFDACLCLAAACSPLPEGTEGLAGACKTWLTVHPRQAKKGAHLFWRSAGAVLSRQALDDIWPTAPLVLEDVARGIAWANTAALARLGQKGVPASCAPYLTFDEQGRPDGGFSGPACRLAASVIPRPTQQQRKAQVRGWLQQAACMGITTVQSMDLGLSLDKGALQVIRQLYREEPALPRLQLLCPPEYRRWAHGERQTEARPAPAGQFTTQEELPRLNRVGGQFLLPVEDGEGLEKLLEHLRQNPLSPDNPRRLTLLGASCTRSRQLREMGSAALGVIAFPGRLEQSLAACAAQPGVELDTCCAWRTLSRLGGKVAFGGLDEMAPFRSLKKAVCRTAVMASGQSAPSKEALTLEEGLEAMTSSAAWTDFQEDLVGRLQPGFRADLQVLDRDVFTCPTEEVHAIRPLLTMSGGMVLHREI